MIDDQIKPVMEYEKVEGSRITDRAILEALGGWAAYLGLVFLSKLITGPDWLGMILSVSLPMALMLTTAYALKSRAMLLGVLIALGMVLLACGALAALAMCVVHGF